MSNKRPVWTWIVATLFALPLLYVLSSGPLRTVAFRRFSTHSFVGTCTTGTGAPLTAGSIVLWGPWWPRIYQPLFWASEQRWGKSLNWYWDLFPIREGTP